MSQRNTQLYRLAGRFHDQQGIKDKSTRKWLLRVQSELQVRSDNLYRCIRTKQHDNLHYCLHSWLNLVENIASIVRELSGTRSSYAVVAGRLDCVLSYYGDRARLEFTKEHRCIVVRTKPVIFHFDDKELNFGEFDIKLFAGKDGAYQTYYLCKPVTPFLNKSGRSHPHLSDFSLCEGEGRAAIAEALRASRFVDFFQIISSILDTFNSGGAYDPLERWAFPEDDEQMCYSCDENVDDIYHCAACEHDFCSECAFSCLSCQVDFCTECRTNSSCSDCGNTLCGDCYFTCKACEQDFCRLCIMHSQRLCEACFSAKEREKESQERTEAGAEQDKLKAWRIGSVERRLEDIKELWPIGDEQND